MTQLVLSLFPGIGLLDMAFEEEGFCVVRGPDLLWGGDIRRFHPPAGRFDGVIGGPPCQFASQASGGTSRAENLIPEFERVVAEAEPFWFVMENVPQAPTPRIPGYAVFPQVLNNRWLGAEQNRLRRFTLGTASLAVARRAWDLSTECVALEAADYRPTVTANGTEYAGNRKSKSSRSTRYLEGAIRDQGLPAGFTLPGFTVEGAVRAVGNGVPLPMGRAVARAVKRALGIEKERAA